MEQEPTRTNPYSDPGSTKSLKPIWIIVITAITTSLVIGLGIYLIMAKVNKSKIYQLEYQIVQLKKQLNTQETNELEKDEKVKKEADSSDWRERCYQSGGQIGGVCAGDNCHDYCNCWSTKFYEIVDKQTGEKIEAHRFKLTQDNQCVDCKNDSDCSTQTKGSWCDKGFCYKKNVLAP